MAPTLGAAGGRHPPRQIGNGAYTILVPKVDATATMSLGFVYRRPVPIGTYTGWNLQSDDLAEDELSGLLGSFIPFRKREPNEADCVIRVCH